MQSAAVVCYTEWHICKSERSSAMNSARINDIDMTYRDEGTGQPLLLIHAFPMNAAMWEPQITALSPRCRVIAPDLRGFGATAPGAGAFSLEQHADDLAALLDHLRI